MTPAAVATAARLMLPVVVLAQVAQTRPTFRSTVDAVTVDVSVRDGNRPVAGLRADDFELADNGVVQTISATSLEALPVDLTLVLDASGSIDAKTVNELWRGISRIVEALRPDERVRLLTFATRVRQVFGWRAGGAVPAIETIELGGSTSFYNALASALALSISSDRRQLIVAFSDGLDTSSFVEVADLRELAARSDAVLSVSLVQFNPEYDADGQVIGTRTMGRSYGWVPFAATYNATVLSALRDAAVGTGGQLNTTAKAGSAPEAFQKALQEFRTSYVLSYVASGVAPQGWHEISVRVKNKGYSVGARKGYFGGPR